MLTDSALDDDRWSLVSFETLAETAATAALIHLGLDPAQYGIAILACDDARIAELNADFRDKPQPTNVLSWPSDERGAEIDGETPLPPDQTDLELGDIAIAYDTCQREAAEAGKQMADHVTHLVVHGTLHLLGYDHERDADATLMEGLETRILGNLGLSDPY